MPKTFTEPTNAGDIIFHEEDKKYSRKNGTAAAGVAVPIGTPVKAAGSNYTPLVGGDESSVVGVAVAPYRGVAADDTKRDVVIIRRQAILRRDLIAFGAADPDATVAALVALGVEVKTSINA